MNLLKDLSTDEYIELESNVFELVYNELKENPLLYNNKKFYDNLTNIVFDILSFEDILDNKEDVEEFENIIWNIVNNFFNVYEEYPRREYKLINNISDKDVITNKLQYVRAIPQPKQRTEEWYLFRHNILTASNLWKIFNTESTYNSFIYDKCKPFSQGEKYGYVNSLHWGKLFEPLSIQIYEKEYNTKVEDFGCIIHKNIPYLGASPDGINVDINSNLYGRMLEIKNIVNREINGIPKEDYWIQMQLQLECCDLEYCDFLETRFKEFEGEEEFYKDIKEKDIEKEEDIEKDIEEEDIEEDIEEEEKQKYYIYKGIILTFTNGQETENKYLPINFEINRENIKNWKQDIINEMLLLGYELKKTYYWYLDELSCIVVKRNKLWFNEAKKKIEEVWNIIQKEKVEGYEHRNTKKKQNKTELSDKVFIQLQDNKYTIYNMPNEKKMDIVKMN